MGRGVSSGGGQSSLGYLFGSGEAPKQATNKSQAAPTVAPAAPKPARSPEPVDIAKQVPAGINSASANYHMRADDQNTGNFITDRPSTKVHSAPGGGSSLGYLFGGVSGGSKRVCDFIIITSLITGVLFVDFWVKALHRG
ncbi:protein SPIRAL1-like 2 [Hibiscus syriacus]|uniref:protein SPIRAL1-like 2 n=1 Tax=Hibiscus syriacus TaxID=106335 RepID=UPI001922B330|nr:protein SPIRAL1-like 2 [Hibiscus syriacus]XP_039003906.1 protein SPIRAL1-like 2 [Hibiscus syriacus]